MRQCICIFIFTFTIGSIAPSLADAETLYCPEPIVDFGEVEEGVKLEYVFTISNNSSGDIHVKRVIADCGCITTIKKEFLVGKGMKTEIPIEFNTFGYGGKEVEKKIILMSGSRSPELLLSLVLKGKIKGIPKEDRVEVYPTEKSVYDDIGVWHTVKLVGPENEKFAFEVSGPNWIDVHVSGPESHMDSRLGEWSISFILTEDKQGYYGSLLIKTNHYCPIISRIVATGYYF